MEFIDTRMVIENVKEYDVEKLKIATELSITDVWCNMDDIESLLGRKPNCRLFVFANFGIIFTINRINQ
ncbi:MAG: hypothetical protein ACK41O_00015 [Runella zeae]